jgi:ABC-type Na+ efflux pump permease subunit
VEEKSTRVVELLLSAVSPIQLMAGKILGQMAVGLTLMVLYGALGITVLVAMSLLDLLSPSSLVYLFLFFFIAYFMIASTMAAIGSAVNDVREAQSLQGPFVIVLMVPYFLWLPISRDPNSTLSVVLSMIPPINPFVMVARIASTEPPPHWQVWLSLLIGAAAGLGMLWAAAKVFRIGLLMFGKPPNLRTLIRWVRMA